MQNSNHPADELLAALAGGDPEAQTDEALRDHVAHCAACRSVTEELSSLQLALAELPDVAPPRPLRLLPPVEEAGSRRGFASWLRSLTGPAMALGGGMVLVGAVGLWGTQLQAGAAGIFANVGDNLSGEAAGASPRMVHGPDVAESPSSQPPTDMQSEGDREPSTADSNTPAPWLTLLVLGMALFLPALVLRFSISPRAG